MKPTNLNTDLKLSYCIAGAMRWGQWGHKLDTKGFQKVIGEYLSIGITTFDHADIYGDYTTEADFGKAISSFNRSDIQIITKMGIQMECSNRPQNKLGHYQLDYDYIILQVNKSLQNLQTDYIDLILVHRPSIFMDYQEIAKAFSDLKMSGKVKHFGVSNFTPLQFDCLAKYVPLVTNQVEASLLHLDPLYDDTFDHAALHQYQPIIWSPLRASEWYNPTFESPTKTRLTACLKAMEEKYAVDEDIIQLAWLSSLPSAPLPIVGTANLKRIQKLEKLKSFKLELQDKFEILKAAQGHPVP